MTQIRPRKLNFQDAKILRWPAGIQWTPADKPLSHEQNAQYFHVSQSWDGYTVVYETKEAQPTKKTALADKPRMWQENGLWHCQRDLVRGKGTTRLHAYRELRWRYALYVLMTSGATFSKTH